MEKYSAVHRAKNHCLVAKNARERYEGVACEWLPKIVYLI